jgi:hypothetical protein
MFREESAKHAERPFAAPFVPSGTRSTDPTLIPIVQALAKLSRRVKHADPWEPIDVFLKAFGPQECAPSTSA